MHGSSQTAIWPLAADLPSTREVERTTPVPPAQICKVESLDRYILQLVDSGKKHPARYHTRILLFFCERASELWISHV
jgi:hypothetical protein